MISCIRRKRSIEIGFLDHIDQEVAEFIDPGTYRFHFKVERGVNENIWIIIFHKSNTGCAGSNNYIFAIKIVDEFVANHFGLFPETRIVCWLPATGLLCIIIYFTTGFLK